MTAATLSNLIPPPPSRERARSTSPLPSQTNPQPQPQPPPLLLTIRFSAALPDLELDIPRPSSTTVISLKHLIRGRLTEPNSQRRLRFIHGGKILPDGAVLTAVLRAPPPPPPRSPYDRQGYNHDALGGSRRYEDGNGYGDGKGIGKGKSVAGRPDPPQRIYVNCSIGDSLTSTELETEAAAAAAPPPTSSSSPFPSSTFPHNLNTHNAHHLAAHSPGPGTPTPSTSTAPRGFDRLLTAGFTNSEVNQLRLQFRSIHSSWYTPDTLPSPDGFRRMEDAWIDDNGGAAMPTNLSGSGSGGGGIGGGGTLGMEGGGTDSDELGLVAMVDVLIRGVITGFMWPLGSAGWLVREEGMASGRWRFMVGVGVFISVIIGVIRAISGAK
ncbi:Uu.00g068840.m01.CDS01 [Anthostomella pinea]|uniref:Uu.00g068840.m01.CDS01 n=1 Tax=Anthostomella pinea TaxID=933095 RepID=A0AAI8VUF3_9PEZI|nr:Uu.00g068840.m01.CDS01 [Anthostomella pinea]